jgi:hypothetical protein
MDNVDEIPQGIFEYNASGERSTINFPEGIEVIGSSDGSVFKYDEEIEDVDIILPESLETIGDNAFFGAIPNMLRIPRSVTTLGSECFKSAKNVILEGKDQLRATNDVFDKVDAIVSSKTEWHRYS